MISIKTKITGLEYKEKTTWGNVFQVWTQHEGSRTEWHQVAKEKGFDSWSQWRSAAAKKINAENREWHRFQITNPNETIPKFLIGPTKTWQSHFPKKEQNQHSFKTLVDQISYQDNEKVQEIKNNFPEKTEFIGVVNKNKKIVLLEGHHRATAIALANKENIPIKIKSNPTIVLAELKPGEEELFKNILSVKPHT